VWWSDLMLENLLDDRLFLTGVFPCEIKKLEDGVHQTKILYDDTPENTWWVVVDYKNETSYPIVGVLHFKEKDMANRYRELVEPTTPLRSLGGKPPSTPLSYPDFVKWKTSHGFTDFHPDHASTSVIRGGTNRAELIYQTKEQFRSGLKKVNELRTRGYLSL